MDQTPVADHDDPASATTVTTDGESSAGRCPFPHQAMAATASVAPVPTIAPDAPVAPETTASGRTVADSQVDAGRCPFPHAAATATAATPGAANGCPVLHGPPAGGRSPADLFVRRLLRIPERPPGMSNAAVYRSFQRSMLISAIRCTLTYVIFPFVLPGIGFLKGVGPVVGVLIGSVAMVCDVFTIRRFFVADHKWRWPFSAIAFSVMCLLAVLWIQDVSHIVGNLVG